jgi:hypothetical protein
VSSLAVEGVEGEALSTSHQRVLVVQLLPGIGDMI